LDFVSSESRQNYVLGCPVGRRLLASWEVTATLMKMTLTEFYDAWVIVSANGILVYMYRYSVPAFHKLGVVIDDGELVVHGNLLKLARVDQCLHHALRVVEMAKTCDEVEQSRHL
jgi:hypothetical protein